MTTTSTDPDTARRYGQATAHDRPPIREPQVTVVRALRSELIKLRSLRSTYYAVLATALSIVGIGIFTAVGATVGNAPPPGGENSVDPTGGSLTGVSLAVYLVAALGVLAVTSEYGNGTIRSTLAAVPKRNTLVWAKALAVGSVTLTVTLISTVTAFLAAQAVLSTADISISLSAPGVLRAVTGAALYLTAVGVFAGGLAWLLRSTAGSLATLFGILTVLPVAAYLLPARVRDDVMPYLPDSAGMAILQTTPGPGQLAPWTGFALFTAYTAITLAAGALLLRRRDA